MNTVATNLLGRWVKGKWVYKNEDYVFPKGGFSTNYSSKELRELTDLQRTYWLYRRVTERIVAVTQEGSDRYAELVVWVLIDGYPCQLEEAVVMPEGWVPEVR